MVRRCLSLSLSTIVSAVGLSLYVIIYPDKFKISFCFTISRDGAYKILPTPVMCSNYTLLLRFTAGTLNVTVSAGTSFVSKSIFLALLQSSQPGLLRAPIMCSHFPHGNEHEITCLARRFLASSTALEFNYEPRNSLLSPSLSKNSAAQVVAAGFSSCLSPEVDAYISSPTNWSCPSNYF